MRLAASPCSNPVLSLELPRKEVGTPRSFRGPAPEGGPELGPESRPRLLHRAKITAGEGEEKEALARQSKGKTQAGAIQVPL